MPFLKGKTEEKEKKEQEWQNSELKKEGVIQQSSDLEKQLSELKSKIENLRIEPRKVSEFANLKERIEKMSHFEEKLGAMEKKLRALVEEEISFKADEINDSLNKTLEKNISERLKSFEEALSYYRDEVLSLKNIIDKMGKENEEKEIELLKGVKKRFQKLESKVIADLSGKFNNAVGNISKSFKEIEALRKELWEIVRGIEEHKNKESRKIDELSKSIELHKDKLEEFENEMKVLQNFLDSLNKQFFSLNEHYDNLKTRYFEIEKNMQNALRNSTENAEKTAQLMKESEEIMKKITEIEKATAKIEGELGEIRKRETDFRLDVDDKFRRMNLMKEEFETRVKDLDIQNLKKEIEAIKVKFMDVKEIKERLAKFENDREIFLTRTKKMFSTIREIEFEMKNELTKIRGYEEKTLDLAQMIERHEEKLGKHEKDNLELHNKISDFSGRIFDLENHKNIVDGRISEMARALGNRDLTNRVIKLENKFEELERSLVSRKELDELKEYINLVEKKNSEILEAILEKFGA